jgi:hypothetical protein
MQLLTPKAIQGYASVLDYEAHILVRSMYYESRAGTLPINPAHFVGRYALKYVAHVFMLRPFGLHLSKVTVSDGC